MNSRITSFIIGFFLSLAVTFGQDIRVWELPQQKLPVPPGQYSGITHVSGDLYAVVDDKLPGGGIVFFEIPMRSNGRVITSRVRKMVPASTTSSPVSGLDNEGVAYADGRLYVSAEGDQSIREYDLDGRATGRMFTIPADLGIDAIEPNGGFEPLAFSAATSQFWTMTELPLKADGAASRLHRLQCFGADFQPAGRYLYQMDEPVCSSGEGSSSRAYVFGISALTALDDGRLLVLEREVYVPDGNPKEIIPKTFSTVKLYVIDPVGGDGAILPKQLVYSFETHISLNVTGIDVGLANYEGMCLGPRLADGRRVLLLLADSQAGMPSLARKLGRRQLTPEYIKVLLLDIQ